MHKCPSVSAPSELRPSRCVWAITSGSKCNSEQWERVGQRSAWLSSAIMLLWDDTVSLCNPISIVERARAWDVSGCFHQRASALMICGIWCVSVCVCLGVNSVWHLRRTAGAPSTGWYQNKSFRQGWKQRSLNRLRQRCQIHSPKYLYGFCVPFIDNLSIFILLDA